MSQVIHIFPKFHFVYDASAVNIYHANKGQGLPKHNHLYTHVTVCYAGKLKVTKEGVEKELTKNSQPVVLTEGEWHELEALEDGTVFMNMFASEFMKCDMESHYEHQTE
jgi:quercetin dioxygenase-like cupin family protein